MKKKNPCLPCMLALNPPRKVSTLLLLSLGGLGGFLLYKVLNASSRGMKGFEASGFFSNEGVTFEDAAAAPVYASSEYYQYPQAAAPFIPPAFNAFSEGQKHELVQAGLQQGLLSLLTCSKKPLAGGQSRYRNCRFLTSEGAVVKFDGALNFVFGRSY
jgi:hypothetical protein